MSFVKSPNWTNHITTNPEVEILNSMLPNVVQNFNFRVSNLVCLFGDMTISHPGPSDYFLPLIRYVPAFSKSIFDV